MRNARLDELPSGIKRAGWNINNLRYAYDTTLMAESEEEVKSPLMWAKGESEQASLKLNTQKTKIMASSPITSWWIVKVAQSCPSLHDPMDYTVHGILQTRILEQVAIPFSRGSSQPRDQIQVSHAAGWFFTNWATREAKQKEGKWKQLQILFLGAPKLLQTLAVVMKLKDSCSLEGKLWQT